MPPAAPREVTRDAVAEWLGHADERITDREWGFVINNQPDAYLAGDQNAMVVGGGPFIVVKRTGGIWGFPSLPQYWPVYEATSEQMFYLTMQVIVGEQPFDPSQPYDRIPENDPR